jgi:hypothetical protein
MLIVLATLSGRGIVLAIREGTFMIRSSRHRHHVASVTSGLALAAVLAATLTASPAMAVPGITDVTDDTASFNFGPASNKTETATCPAGTRVVGGGGGLLGGQVADGLVITQMQPVRPLYGEDFYRVTVNDPSGAVDDWGVRATAICAPELDDMSMAFGYSTASSSSTQLATAVCPTGRKVVGNGGTVYNAAGQAGLQVMRASTDGARVYAQAHEDADGYSGDWYVFAWAVCATAPAGYEIVMAESPQRDSETTKNVRAECPGSKTLLSAGAATGFSAPAQVALQFAHAYGGPTSGTADGYAAENEPTFVDWDFIVAQAICAT